MSGIYDPSERARQKQDARERDDARLRDGEVSRDDLRQEVGLFSSLDLSRSTLVRRPKKVS